MPAAPSSDQDFGVTIRGAAAEQKLFGRFTLKRVLGRGGMGIVWLAFDEELQRRVAMKFLPDMIIRDREAVEDLKRETRRSLDLTHHHIVRIYDFTQDETSAAIVMEYVDGETLSAMKTQQPGGCFAVSVLAPWVGHFCQALDYAHRQARVVHRDLKPANLMVNSRGDMKITDFGISRSMSDSMTRVSMSNTAGTLAYMSPEQALGAPPAALDDVYAFGATIYDLLTGRPPFFRGNLQVQLETVVPPPMMQRREELSHEGEPIPALWEEVIAMCLSKKPQDRPQSMGDVAAMLGLGGPSTGYRPLTGTGYVPGSSGVPTASTSAPPTSHPTLSPDELDTAKDNAPGTAKPATTGTRRTAGVVTTTIDEIVPGFSRQEPAPTPAPPAPEPVAEAAPDPGVEIPEPVAEIPEPVAEVAPTIVEEPAPTPEPVAVEAVEAVAVEPVEPVVSEPVISEPIVSEQLPPPVQSAAPEPAEFEPDYEGLTQRGFAPTPPPEQPAAATQPPADQTKPAKDPAPAFAPHLTAARTTPSVSAPTPVSSPARKGSPKVIVFLGVAIAAILAIGLGAWMAVRDGGSSVAVNPPPATPVSGENDTVPTPPPTFEEESGAIRQAIAAGNLDQAASLLAKLSAEAPQHADLSRLLTSKQKEAADMAAAEKERKGKVDELTASVETAIKDRKWVAARTAIAALKAFEPNSTLAGERLAFIVGEEAKDKEFAMKKEKDAEAARVAAAAAAAEKEDRDRMAQIEDQKRIDKEKADKVAAANAAKKREDAEERERQNRIAAQRERDAEERAERLRQQKAAAAKKATPRPIAVAPPKPDPTPRPVIIVQPPNSGGTKKPAGKGVFGGGPPGG